MVGWGDLGVWVGVFVGGELGGEGGKGSVMVMFFVFGYCDCLWGESNGSRDGNGDGGDVWDDLGDGCGLSYGDDFGSEVSYLSFWEKKRLFDLYFFSGCDFGGF